MDQLNAVITQIMSQCANNEKTQSITASPKMLKETIDLFGLGHFHLDLPNFHWSLFLLMYLFQGAASRGFWMVML